VVKSMCADHPRDDADAYVAFESWPSPRAERHDHILGLICTACSALLFGVVACLVKATTLPILLMVECRGIVQWSVAAVLVVLRFAMRRGKEPITHHLFSPPPLRAWQLLRALLYWSFQLLWWTALTFMPLGDATSLVYCGPLFTGFFSNLLLAEPLTRMFFVCAAMDIVGVCFIVQPSQLLCFLRDSGDCGGTSTTLYYAGAFLALCSAAMAGILPVTVRKSRDVHWTTVEHLTAMLTSFFFTPVASLCMVLWRNTDATVGRVSIVAATAPMGEVLSNLTWSQMAVICLAAAIEFAGLALQTVAYQKVRHAASASLVNYIEVPFAFVLQLTIFGAEGDVMYAVMGALLIVSAGVMHLTAEFKGPTTECKRP